MMSLPGEPTSVCPNRAARLGSPPSMELICGRLVAAMAEPTPRRVLDPVFPRGDPPAHVPRALAAPLFPRPLWGSDPARRSLDAGSHPCQAGSTGPSPFRGDGMGE